MNTKNKIKLTESARGEIPSTYVQLLFEYLQAHSINSVELLDVNAPDTCHQKQRRYSVDRWRRLLEVAALHLNDPMLGLHLGQRITPAHWGVMGYVMMACPTLEAALKRMHQYQRLIYDVNPMRYCIVDDSVELYWGINHGKPGPLVDECAITSMVQFVRHITGQSLPLQQICFVNAEPVDKQAYLQFFDCPVSFDQEETMVRFPISMLSFGLCEPDQELVQVLEQKAAKLLENLPDTDDFEHAVRSSIANITHLGELSLDRVADELNLSPRTLRRRLKSRDQQFNILRDDTLRIMAESYLADHHLTLNEIAGLLGYSEQSAFQRAFKRWVGTSPNIWRQ